ncbi:MAG TPA: type I 3-dehydroquinate dehydratase [Candidatus Nitrosotenuis sp.]|nr:type I 3-dehydroquinate dehydratase [Candidatus Nitrosotenuis sp.]
MAYKTCVSIAETTPKRIQFSLRLALQKSDYAEIRFDFLRPEQVPDALQLVHDRLKRCVCTLRPKSEGGKFAGTEQNRASILKLIAEYRPYLLDLEFSTVSKNRALLEYVRKTGTQILVSWHDFRKTPSYSALNSRMQEMRKLSKSVKIVTTANSINDATTVLSLYRKRNADLIAFSMGDHGRISRILCMSLGSPFTYVSLGKPVAPGQFSVDEVKSIIRLQKQR